MHLLAMMILAANTISNHDPHEYRLVVQGSKSFTIDAMETLPDICNHKYPCKIRNTDTDSYVTLYVSDTHVEIKGGQLHAIDGEAGGGSGGGGSAPAAPAKPAKPAPKKKK